jgi:hypothetical protein
LVIAGIKPVGDGDGVKTGVGEGCVFFLMGAVKGLAVADGDGEEEAVGEEVLLLDEELEELVGLGVGSAVV